jgi:hypothetical protein
MSIGEGSISSPVHALEERLRPATVQSNLAELESLVDDDLLFVGPDGRVHTMADDLQVHRSDVQRVTQAEWLEVLTRLHGSTCITVVEAWLAGNFGGEPFSGCFRYVRTWVMREDGWRIVAGSVTAIGRQGRDTDVWVRAERHVATSSARVRVRRLAIHPSVNVTHLSEANGGASG